MAAKSANTMTGTLKAVRKTKLHEQIVKQIQALIDTGRLKHGDQLPPERELATIFKVSRHSLREAIRILEHKKILKSRPGSGTYIILEEESAVVDFLATAINKEKSTLDEVFQLRELLEPQIAALAAQHATPADHEVLQDIIERQQDERSGEVSGKLDQEFHLALARATGNAVLLQIVELLGHVFSKSRHEYAQSTHLHRLSLQGHLDIVKAVSDGDPEAARECMAAHLNTIRDYVLSPDYHKKGS
jgi:GntR family transcriptional repressor for pyruvate dehydrogenase complex